VDLTRDEIIAITGGRPAGGAGGAVAHGIAFDSRTLLPGEAFVALRAERDGHDYVAAAFARGAALAIVEQVPDGVGGPLVVVPDAPAALRALGAAARDRLEGALVVGITGSAGKTSTKDLTAAALAPTREVHASQASFNNEIGLPVTLVGAPATTQALVLEMGARFAGNITELCAVARPTVGVVTHVGMAHAEHLGGREGITAAKGELLDALPQHGLAVLNADCSSTPVLRHRSAAPVLTAGEDPGADVRVSDVHVDAELRAAFRLDSPWGTAPAVRLAVRGRYQVGNAALAATVALGRVVVLNDSYNASPSSMRAALESLGALAVSGRRIAVLGEMRELGPHAAGEHVDVAHVLADARVLVLVAVGPGTDELAATAKARGVEVRRAADHEAAIRLVREIAAPGDAVLVKASRAVGLERVAHALVDTGSMP
jgi:UDP-N-acetylmuramoyl-tripeptide--D-alanyl-D-alanine ligase